MPLTGKVAGYRQQPQWQQQQQQNQQHPNPNSDPNLAIYGYMDDQKISMIQNWVECQSNQRHVVHQQQHQKAKRYYIRSDNKNLLQYIHNYAIITCSLYILNPLFEGQKRLFK